MPLHGSRSVPDATLAGRYIRGSSINLNAVILVPLILMLWLELAIPPHSLHSVSRAICYSDLGEYDTCDRKLNAFKSH
jgi:hypothetical protein